MAGQGPAVVIELAVDNELARHQLMEVPVDGLIMLRQIRAVWHHDRPPSSTVSTLVAIAEGRPA